MSAIGIRGWGGARGQEGGGGGGWMRGGGRNRIEFSSIHFKMVSMRSEKPITAPPRVRLRSFPRVVLKKQCFSDKLIVTHRVTV